MAKKEFKPMPRLLILEDPRQEARICEAVANFSGNGASLESALGAIVLGQHYGSRMLRMVHSPATIRKYERILGMRYEDLCPEYTHLSNRNIGIKIAGKLGAFWDVVMGRKKVEKKGWFRDPENGNG